MSERAEPLIHLKRLSAFPADAKRMLYVRSEVQQRISTTGGMKGPVDDLIIEQAYERKTREVVHPIVFILPNALL